MGQFQPSRPSLAAKEIPAYDVGNAAVGKANSLSREPSTGRGAVRPVRPAMDGNAVQLGGPAPSLLLDRVSGAWSHARPVRAGAGHESTASRRASRWARCGTYCGTYRPRQTSFALIPLAFKPALGVYAWMNADTASVTSDSRPLRRRILMRPQ